MAAAAAVMSGAEENRGMGNWSNENESPRVNNTFVGVFPTSPTSVSSLFTGEFQSSPSAKLTRLQSDLMDEMKGMFGGGEKPKEHRIIDSSAFKVTVSAVVLINVVMLGIQTDYPDAEEAWVICDHFFAAAFGLEMLLKIFYLQIDYFRDYWNLLDFVLAIMAIVDSLILIIGAFDFSMKQFSVLRMLRLLRLARLGRVFRTCEKLTIVLRSIVNAIESTFWVSGVLLCCIYVFAILGVEFIGRAPEGLYPGYSDVEEEIDEQEVMQNFNPAITFGNVRTAMVTLFNVAILAEWTEIVRPVTLKQPYLVIFFMLFCIFVCFGVMNVIIGMIVDTVMQESRKLERQFEASQKQEKLKCLNELQELIFNIDNDGDGRIELDEVQELFNQKGDVLKRVLARIHLPYGCTPEEFFHMLDDDGDGHLQHDEFLSSLYRLINSGGFQQTCLIQMGVNEMKKMLRDTNERIDAFEKAVVDAPKVEGSPGSRSLPMVESNLVSESKVQIPSSSQGVRGKMRDTVMDEITLGLDGLCEKIGNAVRSKMREELSLRLDETWLDALLRPIPKTSGDNDNAVSAWQPFPNKVVVAPLPQESDPPYLANCDHVVDLCANTGAPSNTNSPRVRDGRSSDSENISRSEHPFAPEITTVVTPVE